MASYLIVGQEFSFFFHEDFQDFLKGESNGKSTDERHEEAV